MSLSPKMGVLGPGMGKLLSVSQQSLAGQCIEDNLELSANGALAALLMINETQRETPSGPSSCRQVSKKARLAPPLP
jgi:hypothetical protein